MLIMADAYGRAGIQITPQSRVTYDPQTGAIRTWFDLSVRPATTGPFIPRDLARHILQESAKLFAWPTELPNLRDRTVETGEQAFSVRFTQDFKGLPTDSSDVIVNMYADSRVYSIYNNYHYDIPESLDPRGIHVDARRAAELIERLLTVYPTHEMSEPELIVYQYHRVENHPPHFPHAQLVDLKNSSQHGLSSASTCWGGS